MLEIGISNALFATILAGIVFLLARVCRHAAVVHTLWLVVLLKLVTPTVLPIDGGVLMRVGSSLRLDHEKGEVQAVTRSDKSNEGPVAGAQVRAPGISGPTVSATSLTSDPTSSIANDRHFSALQSVSWTLLISAAWVVGSVAMGVSSLARILAFHGQIERNSIPCGGRLKAIAERMSNRFGLAQPPMLRVVDSRVSPMVWTFAFRTYVIVPRELLNGLDDEQVAVLLAHEFAHIKRRDHWLRWLELGCVTVYWWLPVAWWVRHQLRRSEEECCDAVVASVLPDKRDAYVSTLLQTVEFLLDAPQSMPVTASGMGQATILKRRCEMILSGTADVSRSTWVLLLIGAMAVLPLGISSDANARDELVENVDLPGSPESNSSDSVLIAAPRIRSVATAPSATVTTAPIRANTTANRPKTRTIPSSQLFHIGDLKLELRELLSRESLVPAKRSLFGDDLKFDDDASSLNDAKAASVYVLDQPSRVFSQVSYLRPSPHPDYVKFVVHGKYDPTSAKQRLIEQVSEVLGQPSGNKQNRWQRDTEIDQRKMVLEFRIYDKTGREGPSLHVILRYRPDW